MAPRTRSFTQRIRDHLGFSIGAILVLFVVLRLFGVRSTVAGFFFSVVITIGLNVGLSYYYEYRDRRARAGKGPPAPRGGGDIRWRDDER